MIKKNPTSSNSYSVVLRLLGQKSKIAKYWEVILKLKRESHIVSDVGALHLIKFCYTVDLPVGRGWRLALVLKVECSMAGDVRRCEAVRIFYRFFSLTLHNGSLVGRARSSVDRSRPRAPPNGRSLSLSSTSWRGEPGARDVTSHQSIAAGTGSSTAAATGQFHRR